MSKNLLFFNKEGDCLNINYNQTSGLYEGDLLFDQNSSDTYKTYGLYMFENIPAFEYEAPNELTLKKFQLFNEWGFHFFGSDKKGTKIKKIEPVNNHSDFYSKWLYGDNIEKDYKPGSLIKFNNNFLEFKKETVYCVVSTKKGAIMIISGTDNLSFQSDYFTLYSDVNSYLDLSIDGFNAVGIYNYIDVNFNNNISKWSEPNFYDDLYKGKKLNVVNSQDNDGVYTLVNNNVLDNVHYEYYTNSLANNNDLIIEVINKTDLPLIYQGGLIISDNVLTFTTHTKLPSILKPGISFKIVDSVNNEFYLTVGNIQDFNSIVNIKTYSLKEQVIFNNKIYECTQSYTQDFTKDFISPTNVDYWTIPTYIPTVENISPQTISSGSVYLTTNKFYFNYGFTQSTNVTLASAAERYKLDFEIFNIDLYYEKNKLKADLKYPTEYANVNFFSGDLNNDITSIRRTYEKLLDVKETLKTELNYDISENFVYNIVFTDLDEDGIKIAINKELYEEETENQYSYGVLDMERTIDKTLRNWLSRNYASLHVLGINANLTTSNNNIQFVNTITLKTEYPNVPIKLNYVRVGATADYHIEHTRVLFNNIGKNLKLTINNKEYNIPSILNGEITDIPSTLENWVDLYSEILQLSDIYVSFRNNLLIFDIKTDNKRFDLKVDVNMLHMPGSDDYIINRKIKGNHGALITSNSIILPDSSTQSFELSGFATGMVTGINNTIYPYDNQNYNVEFLDPHVMNLSYQGPFWGLNDDPCSTSPYTTIAFNLGFGQTACGGNPTAGTGATGVGGPYSKIMFNDQQFSMELSTNPNTYILNTYDLSSIDGVDNMVDILYLNTFNSIYVLGDNLSIIDSISSDYLHTIDLSTSGTSLEMEYNEYNNYVYCLSENKIDIIDPLINDKNAIISLTASANSIIINPDNGDAYITYTNSNRIDIFNQNNVLIKTIPTTNICGQGIFNGFDNSIYILSTNSILKINTSSRSITNTYSLSNINTSNIGNSIFYDKINEDIYIFTTNGNIWKLNSGNLTDTGISSDSNFNTMFWSNLSNNLIISKGNKELIGIDLTDNSIQYENNILNYGHTTLNQYDGAFYMASNYIKNILVINPLSGNIIHNQVLDDKPGRITYNPDRNSVWTYTPDNKKIIELVVIVNSTLDVKPIINDINENTYGTLDPNYIHKDNLWLKTLNYIRKPRENFNYQNRVTYYYKWLSDNVPEFFMYDLSGEQLEKTGLYAYTGPKPFTESGFIYKPNRDLNKVNIPQYQQTVFDEIKYNLNYIDDEDDISIEPEPFELFMGFKSEDEGALRSILQLWKSENLEFTINGSSNNLITLSTADINGDKRGIIKLDKNSLEIFTDKNLRPGQTIVLFIKDNVNYKNKYLSPNNGITLKIREIYTKYIVVDFFDIVNDILFYEENHINNTYLDITFKVIDVEIGRFLVYGQTEIEDIRLKTELNNTGKNISHNEIFIFKEYNIQEGGIDWRFLNTKRKELLMNKDQIYPYIGSYKSIINSINYFGFNDLKLNEYYLNIDKTSDNYYKKFKVEIPDIFDNSVKGWSDIGYMDPNKFEITSQMNLTFDITDKLGNNILNYSLDEITIKLQGLKYWIKRNIMPVTHKITDITGNAYIDSNSYISHNTVDSKILNINQNMTPITCKLDEAYLMPVNSGSTVYNCSLNLYTILKDVGADKTINGLSEPPKPFNGVDLSLPDYFTIKIRTYKTYKEWMPFDVYNNGDKVIYYGKIYQSVVDDNKLNNPREYESINEWSENITYNTTNLVNYKRRTYINTGFTSGGNPETNKTLWVDETKWLEIDFEPVQTINEYRRIYKNDDNIIVKKENPIKPFNFTIDSNIDPFITIEITSDNGWGCIYTDKKNYEIRGTKDLFNGVRYLDPIGPFKPIKLIE